MWIQFRPEQPGRFFDSFYTGGRLQGQFNYWNKANRDGYTNGGVLIGNLLQRRQSVSRLADLLVFAEQWHAIHLAPRRSWCTGRILAR